MSRSKGSLKGVTKLGSAKTDYETKYNPKLLECFENNFPDRDYWVRFICPEFSALNPATGEPYAATILINYIPNGFLVESKSLKLYMFSFRNSSVGGELAEVVLRDLKKLLDPKYIEVEVRATPREGIDGRVMQNASCASAKYRKLAKARAVAFEKRQEESPMLAEVLPDGEEAGMILV